MRAGRCGPGHRARGAHRLFWRVYLNGLLLVALVAAALATAGWVFGRSGPPVRPERYAELAALQVQRDLADRGRLAADLAQARDLAEMTVYREGEVLASNVAPPLPSLPAEDRPRLEAGPLRIRGLHHAFAVALAGHPGTYLVVRAAWGPATIGRGLALVGAVLLAVALAAVPLARGIAAPLERLTAAARRLGAGDLAARSGLHGRGEVGELARAFDEMAERLERLIRAERELLANVSHELRTPLARIRVALDLAAEGDLDASRRYLAEIATDLGELERLVADVLTAARLDRDAGALPLRRERVAPGQLLEQAAARFRASWPGRPLEVRVEEPLPVLDADPALLRRVLDNLLDNAGKYSDEGSPVVLASRGEDGAWTVEVRDRGIGIDPADLPRLFTPFFRTDRSRARGTGGVGLGLALARRIVEAHGGTVAVESAPGAGTAVRVRIPAGG